MDKLVGELACFRKSEKFTKFRWFEVEVAVPRVFFSFCSTHNVDRNALELTKRRHGRPHAFVDHFAKVESFLRQGCPSTLEANLEDGSQDTTCTLSDIDHVCNQSEAVELKLGDVGL